MVNIISLVALLVRLCCTDIRNVCRARESQLKLCIANYGASFSASHSVVITLSPPLQTSKFLSGFYYFSTLSNFKLPTVCL